LHGSVESGVVVTDRVSLDALKRAYEKLTWT
jgi:hypothetical protein